MKLKASKVHYVIPVITLVIIYILVSNPWTTTMITLYLNTQKHSMKDLIPPSQDVIKEHMSKVIGEMDPPYNLSTVRRRQTYFFPRINIFFTGIPKAGCSNWEEALLRAEGRLQKQLNPLKVAKVHGGLSGYYSMQQYVGDGDDVNAATSIIVLRNPWTRAVSGYRQKLSSEKTQGGMYAGMSYNVVRNIRPDNDSNPDPLCTFEEFVKFSVKFNGIHDVHFSPQMRFLDPHVMRYDRIIPLEYADMMADELFRELNKNVSILHSYDQTTDPRQQSSALKAKQWFTELSEKDPKLVEDFYKLYKKDFELLNYSNFSDPNFPLPLL